MKRVFVLLLGLPVLLTACSGDDDDRRSNPTQPREVPEVVRVTVGNTVPGTNGNVGSTGGAVTVSDSSSEIDGVAVDFPEGAVSADTDVTIGHAPVDTTASMLPENTVALTDVIVLDSTAPGHFDKPVTVTIPYDTSLTTHNEMVMAYEVVTGVAADGATQTRLVATSMVTRDTTNGVIQFATRHFSDYIVLEWAVKALDVLSTSADLAVSTGFSPTTDGWFIENYGSILNPGGNCIGMSSFAKWFYSWKGLLGDSTGLYQKYRLGDPNKWEDDEVAIEVASRAQIAEAKIWTESATEMHSITMNSVETAKSFAQAMHDTGQPQILYVSQRYANGTYGGAHAILVTGYSLGDFTIYDPNHAGETRQIPYTYGDSWGIYNSGTSASSSTYHYNNFGHVGPGLFHGFFDMASIYAGAQSGFENASLFPTVTLTNPDPADVDEDGIYQIQDATNFDLAGTITGGQEDPDTTLIFVNGTKFVTPIDKSNGGQFSQTVPLVCSNADSDDDPTNDKENNNIIEFLVTEADGVSDYAGWERVEINCAGLLPVARVTLTWDNGPENDVDLWVTGPDSVSIGYSNSSHSGGAFLDFDDTNGWGPEHYIIPDEHTMPYGVYSVDVHYYDDMADPPDDPIGEGPAPYTVTVEVGVIKDGVAYYETTQVVHGVLAAEDDRHNGVATFELKDPATVDLTLPPGIQDS